MAPRRSTNTGRKKIEIRPIENEAARQVSFSKRREGLFSKASKLATLCGAQVAAVTFSPGGKAFTFGHPSVDSVLDRFLSSNSPEGLAAVEAEAEGSAGDRNQALTELNRKHDELCEQLAAIKARTKAVDESFAKARAEGCQVAAWLQQATHVNQMGDEDLVAFEAALAKLRADVNALLVGRTVRGGGGGGEFELGGTSASGGMVMTPPPPPTGFSAKAEMVQQQQQQQQMMAMPPRTGFAAGMETMQQQQMMMTMQPPASTGFHAGTEMQQQTMMAIPPPPMGFTAGMETMQQQLPGFGAGMETVPQGFEPHGFPQ